jgi:RNA ligase
MEFQAFPKIPRLNRSMVVTEKIDGTNAAIVIEPALPEDLSDESSIHVTLGSVTLHPTAAGELSWYRVGAQSRKRLVTPGKSTDNHGFAGWVWEHAAELVRLLGPGYHYGEWYGKGINRGYGLDHKRFALFNTERWGDMGKHMVGGHPVIMHAVPVLYRGAFNTEHIAWQVDQLRINGSQIPDAEGQPAEGVMVWHNAARQLFKVTLDNDERPKGSKEPA